MSKSAEGSIHLIAALSARELKKFEDKPIMYSKPEVTEMVSSLEEIQSQCQKVQICVLEGPPFPFAVTPGVYQADE